METKYNTPDTLRLEDLRALLMDPASTQQTKDIARRKILAICDKKEQALFA